MLLKWTRHAYGLLIRRVTDSRRTAKLEARRMRRMSKRLIQGLRDLIKERFKGSKDHGVLRIHSTAFPHVFIVFPIN